MALRWKKEPLRISKVFNLEGFIEGKRADVDYVFKLKSFQRFSDYYTKEIVLKKI